MPAIAFACAAIAIALVTWGSGGPVALHPSGGFAENAEYPSVNAGSVLSRRYASWSGSDRNVGSLVSEPFRAGAAISFYVDGYPSHDGESMYLERLGDRARYTFGFTRDPGERWTRVAYRLPPSWFGNAVRLRCRDASRQYRGWIGVADVRNTSLLATVIVLERPWYPAAWSMLLIVVLLACSPLFGSRAGALARLLRAPSTFLASLATALLFLRLPSITSGTVLNADEAQMTAQAITFLHHPIPWLDFDGTTSGPLNTIVAALPALFGMRLTLASSRVVAALLIVLMLVCLYVTLRRFHGDLAARLAVLLALAAVCGGTDGAYLQYASEVLPLTLIAIALLCIVRLYECGPGTPYFAGAAGAAMGALPLAKLQAAPLALFLIVVCAVVVRTFVAAGGPRGTWLWLAGGVTMVPVLVLTAVAANGGFGDFFESYVKFPRAYLEGNCCHFAGLDFFLSDAAFAAFFLVAACLACALALGTRVARRETSRAPSRQTYALVAFWTVMALIAIYMIEAPQTPFVHYLLFLVLPLSGMVGTMLGSYVAALRGSATYPALAASVFVIAIASVAPLARGALAENSFLDHDVWTVQPPADPTARMLEASIRPGQRVAMWGWMPQYLVYTGAVMGTRDSISQFQIEPRSFRERYRARYLHDFLRNRPDFLIEAIGPAMFAYHDRATQGIVSFPALKAVLDASYRVVFDANGVRLFARKAPAPS